MKISDVPKHVTELGIPWFSHFVYEKYKLSGYNEGAIPLYHINYYDGPLSGMIRVEDKYFYVESVYGEEERTWWAAWELTEDELTREQARHKLFQQYVGTHCDYVENEDGDWTRDISKCIQDREVWKQYYDMKDKPTVDYGIVRGRDIFGILRNPFWG